MLPSSTGTQPALLPPSSLHGQRVMITGASSGVGLAAARAFASAGAAVVLLARRSEQLNAVASELGDDAHGIPVDVSDPAAVDEAVAIAYKRLGQIDVLVNAAGIGLPTPLEELSDADWRQVLDINLSGTFYPCRAVGLRMREAGHGSIVNLGSELSTIGMAMYAPYCASKFGVIGLTKALAAELAPQVRVNAVCPGPIDTPMLNAELDWFPNPGEVRARAIERVPLKRFADPGEIVRAIAFLAFDAPFATGTALSIDGGTTMV